MRGKLISIVMTRFRCYRNLNGGKLGPENLFHSARIFPTLSKFGGDWSHQGVGKFGRYWVEQIGILLHNRLYNSLGDPYNFTKLTLDK